MTDNTQPEALRLADEVDEVARTYPDMAEVSAELRRQHARIAELEAQLEAIGAGGVSGPLMGRTTEGMVGGWQDIATAPEGQMVVVGWLDHEDTEHPERHDFDLLEDGCWQQWHERAEHVEVIGGHGVSYTPPYTVWMPVSPIPTSSADSRKGE